MSARPLALCASRFSRLFSRDASSSFSSVYAGVPLATLNAKRRGEALASLVRTALADQHASGAFCNAERGLRIDGRRRAQQQAQYDWLCDGRRVECKSSQLRWCYSRRHWMLRFDKVKIGSNWCWPEGAFDDLFLALYSPKSVHICQHDLSFCVSSRGKATNTSGHAIVIHSSRDVTSWSLALDEILKRLDDPTNSCKRIAEIPLDDARVKTAHARYSSPVMELAYTGVPLSGMSPTSRGLLLQDMVLDIDSMINAGARFNQPCITRCINGARRSLNTAEFDWQRNGLRVECKSAALSWETSGVRWKVHFSHVKRTAFDELLLAIYSPRGVHVYRHNGSIGLSTCGLQTAPHGHAIAIGALAHLRSWSAALDVILQKLNASGCHLLAVVYWDKLDGARSTK